MKAFEKWRKANFVSGRSHKADAKVWRAALEWVLTQRVSCIDVLDADGDSIFCGWVAAERIEQELEE